MLLLVKLIVFFPLTPLTIYYFTLHIFLCNKWLKILLTYKMKQICSQKLSFISESVPLTIEAACIYRTSVSWECLTMFTKCHQPYLIHGFSQPYENIFLGNIIKRARTFLGNIFTSFIYTNHLIDNIILPSVIYISQKFYVFSPYLD